MTKKTKTLVQRDRLGRVHKGGMPTGHVTKKVLDREVQRQVLHQLVLARLQPMTTAQIDAASGISHFMLRDPATGQFKRLTDPDEIQAALNAEGASEGSTYYVHTKDPSTPAYKDLLDRVMGKPVEHLAVEVTANLTLENRLKTAKARVGDSN